MRNTFKGLDPIDGVPDELWTEVRDIVQKAVIKTIPKKKKCKMAKWLSDEALQIAMKRREAKGEGEKERHTDSLWGHKESDTTQQLNHTIMVIWVMKIFFVQFFCIFLPPLLNIFCFC